MVNLCVYLTNRPHPGIWPNISLDIFVVIFLGEVHMALGKADLSPLIMYLSLIHSIESLDFSSI